MEGDDAYLLAHRLAAGEDIDAYALASTQPLLARGLARVATIRRLLASSRGDAASRWGHLERLQHAASGSFGEVFRAWDPTLQRTVALKLARNDVDAGVDARDFVAEARHLARVRHPNVLAVHGAGRHGGRAGLWADWIDGESLRERLLRDGLLPSVAWLRVAGELAGALAAVHASGLVHGDISAANVMFDADGRSVLMDFGAGFRPDDGEPWPAQGTPRYLAPELLRGGLARAASPAIDVYALGVLLHRAATGAYPQDGGAAPRLPHAARALLRDMLAAAPSRRPTADEVVRRLDALRTEPLRRARRRVRQSVVLGLAATALAMAYACWRATASWRETQAALARAETTGAFLADLLGSAAVDALGPRATLRELLDAAPALIARDYSARPLDRIGLLQALADIEAGLANDENAAQLMSRAAAESAAVAPDGDDTLRLAAEALRLRAIAGQAQAASSQAQALLDRATAQGRDARLLAHLEYALAECEFRRALEVGDPASADRLVERLTRLLSPPVLLDVQAQAHALRRLANLHLERDEIDSAVRIGERAVAHAEAAFGTHHAIAALNRRVLGWIALGAEDPARAEALFRGNLVAYEHKLGRRSRTVADDLTGLAHALLAQGRTQQALDTAYEAYVLAAALYPPTSRAPADAALTLADVQQASGDADGSAATLVGLRDTIRRTRGVDNRHYVLATRQLALLRASLGARDEALALLAECEAAGTRALGAASPVTSTCAAQRLRLTSR